MESYLLSQHYDLVTPDGRITSYKQLDATTWEAVVLIEGISPAFVGFKINPARVFFNLKSTLAQMGINGLGKEYIIDAKTRTAQIRVHLQGIGKLAMAMLPMLGVGSYIGKLFAADESRRVRDPDYLKRMFGRADREGKPLLSFGGQQGEDQLVLEKIEGRTVAFLKLREGVISYEPSVFGLLPTLAKVLFDPNMPSRRILQLDQRWDEGGSRLLTDGEILLVRTQKLHVRTVFARVVEELLPEGYRHTTASILEPDTEASGDVYELFGKSPHELQSIPLEFYTLEPHREHVFFSDRDQLQEALENPEVLFKAFETAPAPRHYRAAVFVVKGDQLLKLQPKDWITKEPIPAQFPPLLTTPYQSQLIDNYVQQQPSYPFLKSIEDGLITSEGILLSRHFPSPFMKRMLCGDRVQKLLKAVYFQVPSLSYGDFFSHEDRTFLMDLAKFGIRTYWVDKTSGKVLQYLPKPGKDSGMFVPLPFIDQFLKATTFGVYGSNLKAGNFEEELKKLLKGIEDMRPEFNHILLNPNTPIALVTGGGPGVMEIGNRVAKSLNILSCANIADFRRKKGVAEVNEQQQNKFIDAKMTYRIDRFIERQDEFNLDFPIFLIGGIGTDFEFSLEEVRRKVESFPAFPVLLFGDPEYWRKKITYRYQCNVEQGTIVGSEWISNCFFCVQSAAQGLRIYRQFFSGTLPIGFDGPSYKEGFVIVD